MKKSLFALAAMGAFAGAAQAQSSVTVYGILDVGYINQSVRNAGTQGTTGANGNGVGNAGYGVGRSETSGFGNSAETTSRLGFRGTEDMGGGTRAFFTVEIGLTPMASAVLQANNRQSFVGIGQKGLGQVSIGTQYTPVHEAVAVTDAGQQNNMPGNIIYPADNSVNSVNTTGAGAPAFPGANASNALTTQGGPGTGVAGYTVRASNSLRFMSDRIAGFQGKLMYVQMSNTTNTSSTVAGANTTYGGGLVASTGWAAGLDYTWQKLLVTANYQNFVQTTTAGVLNGASGQYTTTQVAGGTSWPGTAANTNDSQYYLGATYDFGILKAYVQYINRKAETQNNAGTYFKRTGQQIGVRGFATKTIEGWASAGTGKITNGYFPVLNNNNAQQVGATMTGYQLGTNYWLSKRTNLYGIFGIERTGNAVYPTLANGTTLTNNAVSNSINSYAVGVRHTF
jgi:predicted porin